MSALDWVKEVGPLIVSWPVVILILVLVLMLTKNSSRRLSEIFRG
ncbi:unnamed protein product, partial [marine sediment metagenome]